jgi:hypothetical protein
MPGTKQIRIVSKYTNYPVGRVIVTDNATADKMVEENDAEYVFAKDQPEPKRGPGRPPKVIEVAAVEPAQTPEGGGVLKNFRKKRER